MISISFKASYHLWWASSSFLNYDVKIGPTLSARTLVLLTILFHMMCLLIYKYRTSS